MDPVKKILGNHDYETKEFFEGLIEADIYDSQYCFECEGKKTNPAADLCFKCAKKRAAAHGHKLTEEEYMSY